VAFGDSTKKDNKSSVRSESPFMNLLQGERTIRIIDPEEFSYWRYWLTVNTGGGNRNGKSIIVGRDNPLKARYDAIGKGNEGYVAPNKRMALNVVDLTPVIKMPEGVVYPDPSGDYILDGRTLDPATAVPHNVVKILEFGPQLMDLLGNLNGRMRSRIDRRQIGVNDTNILLNISGEKTGRVVTPMQAFADSEVEIDPNIYSVRYDLKRIFAPFPADIIIALVDNDMEWADALKAMGRDGDYPTIV
jgi:hypothetical protein